MKALAELDEIIREQNLIERRVRFEAWKRKYVRRLGGAFSFSHFMELRFKAPEMIEYRREELAQNFGREVVKAADVQIESDDVADITTHTYEVVVLTDKIPA